jgi:thioredoxin-related protein
MKNTMLRMANSITDALMKLLLALLLAAALPAQAQEVPEWFAETLLDVREEVADAAKEGKRLMLYFWLAGCPYCEQMTRVTFRDPVVVERLKRGFVPVGVNVRGDRDIAWTDGATLSEKQLTATLKVRGTPTIVFFDGKGAIASRLVGYVAPAEFARALDSLSTVPTAAPRGASPR